MQSATREYEHILSLVESLQRENRELLAENRSLKDELASASGLRVEQERLAKLQSFPALGDRNVGPKSRPPVRDDDEYSYSGDEGKDKGVKRRRRRRRVDDGRRKGGGLKRRRRRRRAGRSRSYSYSRSRSRGPRSRSRGREPKGKGKGDRILDRRSPSRDGSPPNDWIHDKLIDREQARFRKDFALADAIRDELRAKGITILEAQRRWEHTDGRSGARPNQDDRKRLGGN